MQNYLVGAEKPYPVAVALHTVLVAELLRSGPVRNWVIPGSTQAIPPLQLPPHTIWKVFRPNMGSDVDKTIYLETLS